MLERQVVELEKQIIEINSIPPPFDINGNRPYVIWINGQRADLSQKEIKAIVANIGEENITESNSTDIHKGWLFPHNKKNNNFFVKNSEK
tara:strand:+ start:1442 stop:1711 length:270 start_codon:yes stop_codon:yes gene_type:complete